MLGRQDTGAQSGTETLPLQFTGVVAALNHKLLARINTSLSK